MDLSAANIISLPTEAHREEEKLHRVSLGATLLGIDWQASLPMSFVKEDGLEFVLKSCSYAQGKNFLEENADRLFDANTVNHNFLMLYPSQTKETYYQQMVDHFAFIHQGEMVGYAAINMLDWSTYYLRYINVLPEYRGHKLVIDFVNYAMVELKRAGVERVEAQISANNASQISKHVRMGFVATGSSQSERWGSMIQLTKYLSEKHEAVFKRQFCL